MKLFHQFLALILLASSAFDINALQVNDLSPDTKIEVVFNHLYVVVNEDTFQIMRDHPYFQDEFAAVDSGFPKFAAVNEETQSLYFRGERTYLEIFGPKNKFNEPVGKVGIGFSVEKVGGLDWVEKQLKLQTNVNFERSLRRWDFETETPVNWYHADYRDFPADSKIVWWFSEYHSDFFPSLFPHRVFDQPDISRQTFLVERFDSKRELINLLGCALVMEAESALVMAGDLTRAGFERQIRDDGGVDLVGCNFFVSLIPADSTIPVGLMSIKFERQTKLDEPVRIGFLEHLTVRRNSPKHGWIDLTPR